MQLKLEEEQELKLELDVELYILNKVVVIIERRTWTDDRFYRVANNGRRYTTNDSR